MSTRVSGAVSGGMNPPTAILGNSISQPAAQGGKRNKKNKKKLTTLPTATASTGASRATPGPPARGLVPGPEGNSIPPAPGATTEEGPFRIEGPFQEYFDRFLPWFILDARKPAGNEFHRLLWQFRKYTAAERARLKFNEAAEMGNFQNLIDHFGYPQPYDDSSIATGGQEDAGPARITGPIQDYFDRFLAWFIFDARQPVREEFGRLCRVMGALAGQGPNAIVFIRNVESQAFNDALVAHFKFRFGNDGGNLASWQLLCRVLEIDPVPADLKGAREAVCNTHVNILDLTMGGYGQSSRITKFPTEEALSAYTLIRKRKFPRKEAPEGTILWWLLRRIDHPPPSNSRRDENSQLVTESKTSTKRRKTRSKRNTNRG